MGIKFTKMHGCGNDYIYLDCLKGCPENLPELSKKLSPRHFAVGSDGLICICKSDVADARMRMFNADGSESAMCGNGVRCVAQWLYENEYVGDTASVETGAGIKTMRRMGEGLWEVQMGKAEFAPASLPVQGFGEEPVINKELMVGGRAWSVTCVSMGNPHCVTIVKDAAAIEIEKIGPAFEHHTAFPEGVNVEFIQLIGPQHVKMRVWERGSGETLACGTGACATAAACVAMGLCEPQKPIQVDLLGGTLTIVVSGNWRVQMTGPTQTVFVGETCI